MAILQHARTGSRYPLAVRTLIGRSGSCQLQLTGSKVSGLHAELMWDGHHWLVHDLGSRNGTTLDGQRLAPEERRPLGLGCKLAFGTHDERFEVVDVSPPSLVMVADDGTLVSAHSGLLCLPSDEAPEVALYEHDGRWRLETERGVRPLVDEERITVAGVGYRVFLPGTVSLTAEGAPPPMSVSTITLQFHVSLDEETVQLRVRYADRDIALKSRAHDFFLLTLARARLEDERRGDLPRSEHGWMYRSDLARRLKVERGLLNLWVHRARRQLADAGVTDVADLVQRRHGAEQLRIGVARLEVHDGATESSSP